MVSACSRRPSGQRCGAAAAPPGRRRRRQNRSTEEAREEGQASAKASARQRRCGGDARAECNRTEGKLAVAVSGAKLASAGCSPCKFYEELQYLGAGAFGAAVLVRRRSDGRRFVAKKCCIRDMDSKQRAMCLEEIALLRKVRHECIAEVVDFRWASSDALEYWLVLKYYSGGDVQKEIDTCREEGFEMPLGKAKNWIVQVCMALQHVHSLRIVHRDVKGSNMFVTGASNIVLGDFGVSKQLSDTAARAMTSVGSPVYMAPEWWDGRGGTAASDMWSVGVVLYELITLQRPFDGGNVLSLVHKITNDTPKPLPKDCDHDLRSLVSWLLEKQPAARPTASQALNDSGLKGAANLLHVWRKQLEGASERKLHEMACLEDAALGRETPLPPPDDRLVTRSEKGLPTRLNLADIARRASSGPASQAAQHSDDECESGEDDDEEAEGDEETDQSSSAVDEGSKERSDDDDDDDADDDDDDDLTEKSTGAIDHSMEHHTAARLIRGDNHSSGGTRDGRCTHCSAGSEVNDMGEGFECDSDDSWHASVPLTLNIASGAVGSCLAVVDSSHKNSGSPRATDAATLLQLCTDIGSHRQSAPVEVDATVDPRTCAAACTLISKGGVDAGVDIVADECIRYRLNQEESCSHPSQKMSDIAITSVPETTSSVGLEITSNPGAVALEAANPEHLPTRLASSSSCTCPGMIFEACDDASCGSEARRMTELGASVQTVVDERPCEETARDAYHTKACAQAEGSIFGFGVGQGNVNAPSDSRTRETPDEMPACSTLPQTRHVSKHMQAEDSQMTVQPEFINDAPRALTTTHPSAKSAHMGTRLTPGSPCEMLCLRDALLPSETQLAASVPQDKHWCQSPGSRDGHGFNTGVAERLDGTVDRKLCGWPDGDSGEGEEGDDDEECEEEEAEEEANLEDEEEEEEEEEEEVDAEEEEEAEEEDEEQEEDEEDVGEEEEAEEEDEKEEQEQGDEEKQEREQYRARAHQRQLKQEEGAMELRDVGIANGSCAKEDDTYFEEGAMGSEQANELLRPANSCEQRGKNEELDMSVVATGGVASEKHMVEGSSKEQLSQKMPQGRSQLDDRGTHSSARNPKTLHNRFSAKGYNADRAQCNFNVGSIGAGMPLKVHCGPATDAAIHRHDIPHGFGVNLETCTFRLQQRLLDHATEAETFSVPPRRVPQRLEKRAYSTLRGFARSGNGCIAGAIASFSSRIPDVH